MKIKFLASVFFLFALTLTILLGFWQLNRAHYKEGLEEQMSNREKEKIINLNLFKSNWNSDALNYRRVAVTGVFMPQYAIYLDNRPYNDQAGFYLIMPMRLSSGQIVLINRGWLPRNPEDRTKINAVPTSNVPLTIQGTVRDNPTKIFELKNQSLSQPTSIRANLDVETFNQKTGLTAFPFFIMQTSDSSDGLIRDWPRPKNGAERNYGYMVQWWGLAAALFIYVLIILLRRRSKK